jgi:hypothetical protein
MLNDILEKARNTVLVTMISHFQQTYTDFIDTQGLPDDSVTRAGVFAAFVRMVKENPIPWPAVQCDLQIWLEAELSNSLNAFHQSLTTTFDLIRKEKAQELKKALPKVE